tara:strand:+ start:1735 stop:3891 length:2157 start_codon:yes stop_codon:yes gene_type:complete
MSAQSIQPPFTTFQDIDGSPLEAGKIYIGTAGSNAVTNQIPVYSDKALSVALAQPITTRGGYPVVSGAPVNIYVAASSYSLSVNNKHGSLVTSSLTVSSASISLTSVGSLPLAATTGDVAIVNEIGRGGTFVFNSLLVGSDNQGTNFNGWIRQYTGAVQATWFGTGTADDSALLQKIFTADFEDVFVNDICAVSSTVDFRPTGKENQKTISGNNAKSIADSISAISATTAITIAALERNGSSGTSANYTIKNLAFTGTRIVGQIGLRLTDVTHIRFENCQFKSLDTAIDLAGTNFIGIVEFIGCTFRYCNRIFPQHTLPDINVLRFEDCEFKECTEGLYFERISGVSGMRNVIVQNCTFEEIDEHSIFWTTGMQNLTVLGNYFESNVANKQFAVIYGRAGSNPFGKSVAINNNAFSEIIDNSATAVIDIANISEVNITGNYSIFTDTIYPGTGYSMRLVDIADGPYTINNLTTPTGEVAKTMLLEGVAFESTVSTQNVISVGTSLNTVTIDNVAAEGTKIFEAKKSGATAFVQMFTCDAGGAPSASAHVLGAYRNQITSRSINAAGTINASGADYAEYEHNNGLTFKKGDLVGFKSNGTLTNKFSESLRFGVKSTSPAYVGGDSWFSDTHDPEVESKEDFSARLEAARLLVDRIAYCGKVPCNILSGSVGDYIVPVSGLSDSIMGASISSPSLSEFLSSVGRINKISGGVYELVVITH